MKKLSEWAGGSVEEVWMLGTGKTKVINWLKGQEVN